MFIIGLLAALGAGWFIGSMFVFSECFSSNSWCHNKDSDIIILSLFGSVGLYILIVAYLTDTKRKTKAKHTEKKSKIK